MFAVGDEMKTIAILGGTFDPIHNAHLELARVLTESLKFEKILFIPCKQNPLKAQVNASTQQRIEMIQLAINAFTEYECDSREINRDSPSYTIETLKSLRHDYPMVSIAFTMGVDSFNDLEQWDNFEEFLAYAHLIIFPRPGYVLKPEPPVQALIEEAQTLNITNLHTTSHGYIYFTDIPKHPISSTEIRTLLKENNRRVLPNYLPKEVLAYINVHHLYTQ